MNAIEVAAGEDGPIARHYRMFERHVDRDVTSKMSTRKSTCIAIDKPRRICRLTLVWSDCGKGHSLDSQMHVGGSQNGSGNHFADDWPAFDLKYPLHRVSIKPQNPRHRTIAERAPPRPSVPPWLACNKLAASTGDPIGQKGPAEGLEHSLAIASRTSYETIARSATSRIFAHTTPAANLL